MVGGCAPPLSGPWSGGMDCGGLDWVVNMQLDYDGGNLFVGTGEQEREFIDSSTGCRS